MQVTGLIGILIIVAGAFLVWQARREVLYWLREFVRTFRHALVRSEGSDARRSVSVANDRDRQGALLLAGAIVLIFLGQVLVLIDLAF